MNTARILYPVRVLGPGERIGIWVAGCSRRCPSCSNPELWQRKKEYEVTPEQMYEMILSLSEKFPVDGFTVSGGEPMDQAAELNILMEMLKPISSDFLVYTGYTLDELRERKDPDTDAVLSNVSVLIDGEYIEEENRNVLLRGSANQRIHIMDPSVRRKYDDYLAFTVNQIQNFTVSDGIISVGIHRRGF